jgi:bacterioferritin-associated ferredoxin
MIICSCNVFSDDEVRTALVGSGLPPRTAGEVYNCLGCSPQCGRCARTIRRIMDEALGACAACPMAAGKAAQEADFAPNSAPDAT